MDEKCGPTGLGETESIFKYDEEMVLDEIKQYVAGTYAGHYTSDDTDVQLQDILHSVGGGCEEEFYRGNVLKLAARFGREDGRNRKDLLKIAHYTMLWLYFSHLNDQNEAVKTAAEIFEDAKSEFPELDADFEL